MATAPRIPKMVDTSSFTLGTNLGATPGAVVVRTPVFELIHYKPTTAQVREDAAANGGSFALVALDLASLKSVRACADELLARGDAFDVVIANAGVMATPFGHTLDGFETSLALDARTDQFQVESVGVTAGQNLGDERL